MKNEYKRLETEMEEKMDLTNLSLAENQKEEMKKHVKIFEKKEKECTALNERNCK